jgi:4-diphosphocytidyl-2-C-methyl-D-erythritol kinase
LCDNLKAPSGKDNLCYQAAKLFLKETGIKQGVEIEIHKVIPVRAGLGGGSADAAAALHGMSKLFEVKVSYLNLLKWAERLGADVPFCLKGGTALVKGKGENILPLPPIRKGWLVLVDPEIPIPTFWIYKKLKVGLTKKRLNVKLLTESLKEGGLYGINNFLYNKLEEVAFEEFPLMRKIKEEMLKAGACGAGMTGSGSTIFAVAEEKEEAENILSKLEKRGKVYLVQPIDKSVKEA